MLANAMTTQQPSVVGFKRKPQESVEQAASVAMLERAGVKPRSSASWSMDRTAITFVHVSERLSLIASCGPGHPESRTFYAAHAPSTCAAPDSVIFWDLSQLLTTDLGVVSTCLSVGKANRHNIAAVHMHYRSPMVGMAVTVGNVALGGLIRLYKDAESFHEALLSAARGE
jgi:hypothetical protein